MAENLRLARDIIFEVLGEDPEIFFKENKFFFVKKNGEPCELKIAQEEEAKTLEIEANLYTFIQKETSLPVPKVLEKGRWGTLVFLLSSSFGETCLQDVIEKREHTEGVLFSAGQLLGILHSIEIRQRGLLTPDLSIEEKRLYPRDKFTEMLRITSERDIIPEHHYKKLNRIDIDFFFYKKPNVLSHGTYVPRNLFVEKNRVTGILGWEKSRSAPPYEDLSSFSLELEIGNGDISPTPFYDGYSWVKPLPSIYLEFEEFYKFYTALLSLYQTPVEKWERKDDLKKDLLMTYLEKSDTWPEKNFSTTF